MWLQLNQIKTFHQREREKISISLIILMSQKSEKHAYWTHVVIYLSVHSCDTMHRLRESNSRLELF